MNRGRFLYLCAALPSKRLPALKNTYLNLNSFALKKGENGDKIVGGQDAVVGQFPWQVLWTNDYMIYCGGTIFNESTIITAAHCCKV